MESNNLIAKAEATIDAPVEKVWDGFVNPEVIKQYMGGSTVESEWTIGSKITWKGEWKGKPYEDKGEILDIITNTKLQYSHFSPLAGLEDIPENYHTVSIDLTSNGNQTIISLAQDKNATEEACEHSQKNWEMMLNTLKKVLEEAK